MVDPLLTYSRRFQYSWDDKYLSTGYIDIPLGKKSVINLAGNKIPIYLPPPKSGVRGFILSDPCFHSDWLSCLYAKQFRLPQSMIELVNAIAVHGDIHFWDVLGDIFYDKDGQATSQWFSMLSSAAKGMFFGATPGNHDIWINGQPILYSKGDPLGTAFMQFYGQDTMSSANGDSKMSPYNMTTNVDKKTLPPASNFFYYHQIGNVVKIGYSTMHHFQDMVQFFREACVFANLVQPDVVILEGHCNHIWNGCKDGSTVPQVYKKLSSIDVCLPIASKVRYFMGHQHCNLVWQVDVGFLVGGQGMPASRCGGSWGIPIVDTTMNLFRVLYFPLAKVNKYDNIGAILDCFRAKGVSNCYHLAEVWANVTLGSDSSGGVVHL